MGRNASPLSDTLLADAISSHAKTIGCHTNNVSITNAMAWVTDTTMGLFGKLIISLGSNSVQTWMLRWVSLGS